MGNHSKGSLKLVRIHGVDLKAHSSLIFLLIYVVMVAGIQFPNVVQQSGIEKSKLIWGPWFSGFLFALGLLLSVALHEFGHVLVAQAQGVKVRGITLMMLGGISEMDRPSDRPYAEFKLAAIGPIVSFCIAGVLWFMRFFSKNAEVQFFSFWLGSANLVLGIFNLLPAFPMDGGRVLRSLLAVRQGSLKATEKAIQVSRVCSWLLGVWGIWTFNLILVLIAFFIYSASEAERLALTNRGMLKGLHVGEMMTRLIPLTETMTLSQVATEMGRSRVSVYPVLLSPSVDKVGLISIEDLKSVSAEAWPETKVSEVMNLAPRVVLSSELISDVFPEVASSPLKALPVEEKNVVVGVIQYSDILNSIPFKNLDKAA